MDSRDTAVVGALLVPIVTAVVEALAIQFQDWQVNRSLAAQRRQAIEEASRQVGFVSEWWQASQMLLKDSDILKGVEAQAASWLDEAGRHAASAVAQPRPERQRGTLRRLFLLQRPTRPAARIIRIGFYAALLVVVGVTASVVSNELTSSQRHTRASLAGAALAGAVALGLRFWAVSTEEGARRAEWPQVQPRRLLLAYPMHGRSAHLSRLAFYALSVAVVLLSAAWLPKIWRHPRDVFMEGSPLAALAAFTACARLWAISIAPPQPPREREVRLLRRIFLFYDFDRLGAKVVRTAFYVCAALFAVTFTAFLAPSTPDRGETLFGTVIIYAAPALAFRAWAVHIEKARSREAVSIQLPESRRQVVVTEAAEGGRDTAGPDQPVDLPGTGPTAARTP
jgi:hypothetical protein